MNDIHGRLIDLIEAVPEDQFQGGTRFRHRLRLDTYTHYPKHSRAIQKWREREILGDIRSDKEREL
jgi:hypothetical protein